MQLLGLCPLCSGSLQYGTRTESFNYKDKTFTVEMNGEYCNKCNESFYNIDDAKKNERNIALAKLILTVCCAQKISLNLEK